MVGEGPGAGYNINVPWENTGCGDADYLAVWDHILLPVAKEFDPDMIIVSAGLDADPLYNLKKPIELSSFCKQILVQNLFNTQITPHLILETAVGDPLGGCRITPYGYSVMLKKIRAVE
ncbi:histone deacetylase 18-like isoform X1 [Mercurialis annua]|uniref:histone deacetylase 18-like isoform X1 n=1 Tax=Mercurialis annua TaxID=3986 RepID=UPI0024ACF121|nr:histone deacetylase 18-like isoform X1 [Mercurialis annua]